MPRRTRCVCVCVCMHVQVCVCVCMHVQACVLENSVNRTVQRRYNVLIVICSTPPHRPMKLSFSITSQKPPIPWDKQSHLDWKHSTWSVRGTHIPGFLLGGRAR